MMRRQNRGWLCGLAVFLALAQMAHAMERVMLSTGFPIDCVRHEAVGDKVRLYLAGPDDTNYIDVPANKVVSIETMPDPPKPREVKAAEVIVAEPSPVELGEMLAHAGATHNIDAELLASVVHAESGGNVHAVSRTGARGLMQLMPGTAAAVGVTDTFVASQNVEGGTRYLDQMLTRYHDNLAKALAAYNAGPGAVDHFHGVPPYRETQAYVARVIREFNRRKLYAMKQNKTLLAKGQ